MNPIFVLQQAKKINEISNHVKSQLRFQALEDDRVQKVHFQKILPTLNRLLTLDPFRDILALFDTDAIETIAHQLLQLLSDMGEIAKLPGGYYLPLPVRAVELPVSKKVILLSDTINGEKRIPYIGFASGYGENNCIPLLTINEWLPSIDSQEFFEIIKNSHYYEIKDDPTQVFLPKEKRGWDSYEIVRSNQNIDFIAKFNIAQGVAEVASYYWAKKRRHKTKYFIIPNQYLDLAKYTLENLNGIHRKIEIHFLDRDFFTVKFRHRLSKVERIMLMLFAFPENIYDPFDWIVPKVHYEDFVFIVNRLGMRIQNC
ncbi:hypothetical protein KW850_25725 [Bacillus sp. sid0103]|uniref:hypothetical protein n=1 Tax=Bacillus sp. sid0103 TaxID=2856337 RepID=UPI001C44682A|nr:hypothetical protein [Bacillus sp. sid0103]MBV7508620.1 hypothetical protein [Bacillus sp. sid0103]